MQSTESNIDYDLEEERYLNEFVLSDEGREEADEIVGAFMDSFHEMTEQHLVEKYSPLLRATTEKERYIGRKLQEIQIELFAC